MTPPPPDPDAAARAMRHLLALTLACDERTLPAAVRAARVEVERRVPALGEAAAEGRAPEARARVIGAREGAEGE